MKRVIFFSALAAGVGACASPPGSPAPAVVKAEIEAARSAFSEAYVRGDTAVIGDLYEESAVLLPPGREIRGREAVVRYFSPVAGRVNLHHSMESSELQIDGDVAVDVGRWSYTWQAGDAEERTASDRYLIVWRRGSDGRWRIAYDMWHRSADQQVKR